MSQPLPPRAADVPSLPRKTENSPQKPLPAVSAWLALTVVLVIATALAGMIWLLQSSQDDANNRDRIVQMRLISGALTSSFDQAAKFALALAETTARRPDIGAALAAGDRAALQRLSQGAYSYLKDQAGIQIYGYHTKDIRYLLRMHRADSFNDDISGFRTMVVAANKTRRPQTGIEIGIAGIGVRGIAVVNHNDEMAGTMEVGLDLRPIIELVKASTNADIAVIVVPSLSGVALDETMPSFGDLKLAVSTDNDLFTSLLKDNRIRPTRDIEIRKQQVDTRSFNMVTQPLVDFSGRLVGMTIALKDDAHTDSRRIRTELWVLALCGAILAFVVFAVLFQAALARHRGS